jgi:activator of 2-hydroxyglutaryl-CoA dehydratase
MSQTYFTVIAIDGQDLEPIIMGDGMVVDFAMNPVGAAGRELFGSAGTAAQN